MVKFTPIFSVIILYYITRHACTSGKVMGRVIIVIVIVVVVMDTKITKCGDLGT